MKVIKFTPELTNLIKKGKKKSTFRLFDDKNLSAGDDVILAARNGQKVINFAHAKLTQVHVKPIKDLNRDDYAGHEPVKDPVENYKKYYGDKVTKNTEVKIIRFDITKFL